MRISIVLASVLSLSAPLIVQPATGQDVNPYGRIDPIDASAAVLERAFGPDAVPAAVVLIDEADPPGIENVLDVLLSHPNPLIRTTAAVRAAGRGRSPAQLSDRMTDEDARAAFVVGLLAGGHLTPAVADELLRSLQPTASPVATAILAGCSTTSAAGTRLASIADDPTAAPLARGIAAGCLERTSPGAVSRWLQDLESLSPEIRDRVVFETVTALEPLEATAGVRALLGAVEGRPADDALRATVVMALLQLDPGSGLDAWTSLATEAASDRAIPNAMLLVSAERPLPADAAGMLPAEDDLQKAVRTMLMAEPSERRAKSIDAVRLGHLPTIRWLLEPSSDAVPPDVLDAMIDSGLSHRRAAMIDVLLEAAARLAASAPDRIERRLSRSELEDATLEILLRGLIRAGTPESAVVAKAFASASNRRTRSLAVLALACGGTLEPAQVRMLGRAAAGGGDLPDDLRPLAAWYHLSLEGRLEDTLQSLATP